MLPAWHWMTTAGLLVVTWAILAVSWWKGGEWWSSDQRRIDPETEEVLKHAPAVVTVGVPLIFLVFFWGPWIYKAVRPGGKVTGGRGAEAPNFLDESTASGDYGFKTS